MAYNPKNDNKIINFCDSDHKRWRRFDFVELAPQQVFTSHPGTIFS